MLGLGSGLPSPIANNPFPEDLFRYDASGNRSFTTSSSAKAFFSLNGRLAQFDNQNDGGDFGDWQSNPLAPGVAPQVQDAFATAGSNPVLGENELTALDVIGYNLAPAVQIPEPATGLLFAFGLAGGLVARRAAARKTRATN